MLMTAKCFEKIVWFDCSVEITSEDWTISSNKRSKGYNKIMIDLSFKNKLGTTLKNF